MSNRRPTKKPGWVEVLRVAQRTREVYRIKIDVADLPTLRRHRWQRHKKGMIRYRGKNKGKGCVLLHRAILKLPKLLYVIFRNGDRFDVRRRNLKIITQAEQRAMKKLPSIRTLHQGRPTGVTFPMKFHHRKDGGVTVHRYATAHVGFRYKQWNRNFNIDKLGMEEAVRQALAWRVGMIRQHGLEPNPELLAMLQRVTRMCRAGGGHDELFGGNADYENSRVQPWEVHHAFDANLAAA